MTLISTPVSESRILIDDDLDKNGARVVAIVERWHNDTHSGAFRTCSEQPPCHAIVYSRPGGRG